MNKNTVMVAGVIAVVVILGVGFAVMNGADDSKDTIKTTTSGSAAKEAKDAVQSTDDSPKATQELNITMSNFKFSINAIEAKPGDTIKINLGVSGGTHNLAIDEFDLVSSTIASGQTDTVVFTIPEDATVGQTYDFYCNLGSHRAQGMEGQITVN